MAEDPKWLKSFQRDLIRAVGTPVGRKLVQSELSRLRMRAINNNLTPEQRRIKAISAVNLRWDKVRAAQSGNCDTTRGTSRLTTGVL